MLEARIMSARGSLYFAAEGTPYDLETLRLHLAALAPDRDVRLVRVDVSVDGSTVTPAVARWLRQLVAAGVRVHGMPALVADPGADEAA